MEKRTAYALVAAVAALWWYARRRRVADHFFTHYASEEPTRPYTPYTGTEPRGVWGADAFIDAADGAMPPCAASVDSVL